ncbi:MAG: T9SS type A sorting domain-containing protein, partial [Cyclobacteriaceae bacterium]|nr:T9SS type A sorting domain-containing protein [Cyclobacteriaceae bacterium]
NSVLPSAGLITESGLDMYIAARDLHGNLAYSDTLRAIQQLDNEPPSINNINFPDTYSDNNFPISADITDNALVETVRYWYKGVNQSSDKWQIADLSPSNNPYVLDVSGIDISSYKGFMFYVVATDPTGNSISSDTLFSALVDQNTFTLSLEGGRKVSEYQLVSFPLNLSSNSISEVIEDNLGPYKKNLWRMFRLGQSGDYEEHKTNGFTSVSPGEGYWILSKKDAEVDFKGSTNVGLHVFQLKKGWNLIGNPYNYPVNWRDIVDYGGGQSSVGYDIFHVDKGASQGVSQMEPFKGYFVFASSSVQLNYSGKSASGGRTESDEEDWTGNNWKVGVTVSKGDFTNTLPGVGMHEMASDGFDRFDQVGLPRFLKYIELNVGKYAHDYQVSRDILPTADSAVWEFGYVSNIEEGTTELGWVLPDNIQKELYLYDKEEQRLIDMKTVNRYSAGKETSGKITILYGDIDFILRNVRDHVLFLERLYPNPAKDIATLPITVTGEGTELKVELYDISGRLLSVLFDDKVGRGPNELELFLGNGLKKGMYFINIMARNKLSQDRKVEKIFIK